MYVNLSLAKDPAALIPAIIIGLTLYAIPSWETSNYKMTLQVNDVNNNEHFYELSDRITLVQWLPMVLAFPFAYPFTAEENLIEKMYDNVSVKISQDIGG